MQFVQPSLTPAARILTGLVMFCLLVTMGSLLQPSAASYAAPDSALRLNITQRGNVVVIGNTLGHECATGVPAPVVGLVGACGANTADSAIDIFWRSDSPTVGQAEASTSITNAQARSTAMLTIPNAASVTHAYLYWAARWNGTSTTGDLEVTIESNRGNSQQVTAISSIVSGNASYQSVADVTSYIQQSGSGAYRVSGIASNELAHVNDTNLFAAWWLVVVYADASQPRRTIIISDEIKPISSGTPLSANLSGFSIPSSSTTNLTIVGYEGDNTGVGDQIQVNGNSLSNVHNPVNNIMNSSYTYLGNAVSVAGDLPQLAGTPGSMSGFDIDTFDVSAFTSPNQTEVNIAATSVGDVYYIGGLVLAITSLVVDTPTPTETPTSTPTDTPTPTNTPTDTPMPTNTLTATATNTSTNTPTSTLTPSITPTNTETPVAIWQVFLPVAIRSND